LVEAQCHVFSPLHRVEAFGGELSRAPGSLRERLRKGTDHELPNDSTCVFLSIYLSLSSSLRRSETSASSKWPAAARSCTRSTSPTLVSRIGFERDCLVAVAVLVGTRRDEKSPTRVCGSSRSPIRTSAACTSAAVKSPMPASAVSSPALSFSPSPHANHSIRDVLQSHALKKKISRRTATAFRS
jgi:hypothetical protein